MSSPNMNLEYLLAPVAPEEFFAQHGERRPLVVARDDEARYAGLLDASDIEHVITSACEQKSTVELV
ncbi:MAG TPA: hypothetical protein VEQ42_10845, partial [Pyrinomonadaceae bacterium]|nr:hypothetical protein [Pyrinomonadaceae bacterium]